MLMVTEQTAKEQGNMEISYKHLIIILTESLTSDFFTNVKYPFHRFFVILQHEKIDRQIFTAL